ncbi:MAG: hypothetical protein DMG07_00215 [Acidobacteria bacterium]|nr:MAG: hypothetical protein DMG07_00215 [Acidobacteriota bacterium]
MRESLSVHRCSVGFWLLGAAGLFSNCGVWSAGRVADGSVVGLGSRLELPVDDYLIERWSGGATARLHQPEPRGLALEHDEPWEGNSCGYHTVFRDGPLYRMY